MIHIKRPEKTPTELEKDPNWERYQAEIQDCLANPQKWGNKLPRRREPEQKFPKLLEDLYKIFNYKCAYCESKLDQDGQITWYRPRRNAQQLNKDGSVSESLDRYFWLSWEWNNMYPACQGCVNQKQFSFPVASERAARGVYGQKLLDEQPLLLDPCFDNPLQHLEFHMDGKVYGKDSRGDTTILILDLNGIRDLGRTLLVAKRADQARSLHKLLQIALDVTIANGGNINEDVTAKIASLRAACMENQEFAGMKRQLLQGWLKNQPLSNTSLALRYGLEKPEWKELVEQLNTWVEDRHIIPIDKTISKYELKPIHNRWALLVGINRYIDPGIRNLKYCVNDVLTLENYLESIGYTVVSLHDDAEDSKKPTRDNIKAELTNLCNAVGTDDLLYVHFGCHGTVVNKQPILITSETRWQTLESSSLKIELVKEIIDSSKAQRRVLTIDACHAGIEVGRGAGDSVRNLNDPKFVHNVYDLAIGFALLAASTKQQVAYDWDEKGHGAFTYFLLEGLKGTADYSGKKFVTVNDLHGFVLDRLRKWTVEHGLSFQEPTFRSEGMGDMILADYRSPQA